MAIVKRIWWGIAASALPAMLAAAPVHITLLHTTDMHGYVHEHKDKNGTMVGGLDRIATIVKRERSINPNTLLLDCGDTLQGNSMAFLFKGKHIIECMNALSYDAMVIGNHDFNFGQDTLALRKWESAFPWLSANVLASSPGRAEPFNPALPYIIKVVDGVKVGIVGLTVTDIPLWEQPQYIERLAFEDILQAAQEWTARVRPLCDVLIVMAHTGVEPKYPWNKPGYDPGAAGVEIAKACPDIDVMLCGHRHVQVASRLTSGVLLTEAGNWTDCLGKVQIIFEPGSQGSSGKVVGKTAKLIPIARDTAVDTQIAAILKPYDEKWKKWADKSIGRLAAPLDFRKSQTEETSAVDMIHDAMRAATGADVTFHVAFNNTTVLPAGTVTNQSVFDIYEYDNALWVLTLTGRQIKDVIEAGASRYGTWRFLTAGGLNYALDVSRPKGERLLWVKYKGKPLADSAVLTAAVNHYNAMGGGDLIPLKKAANIHKTGKWVRDVIVDYIRSHSPVTPGNHAWWTVVGGKKKAAEAGLASP